MKKIQFIIEKKTLSIGYKIENNTFKNINNTNIISNDDLIFDINYFKNNLKLVAGFLNVMIKNDNVKSAVILHEDLILTSFDLIAYMPSIETLEIKPDVTIDHDTYLAILKNDTLKKIKCYSIPNYLLEQIDSTKTIKIDTRAEVFFVSKFLEVNNLNNYSDVFYKKKITIDYNFSDMDFKDFEQFLSVNSYLRIIYFDFVNMNLIKKIIKSLSDNNKQNIIINIKGTKENLLHFQELEEYVKKSKYAKKNNIKFRIDYTRQYKLDNFLKLINFTTAKYLLVGIIISCIVGYGFNQYNIFKSSSEVDAINDNIQELLENFQYLEPVPVDPNQSTEEPPNGNSSTETPPESQETPTPNTETPPPTPTTPTRPAYVSPYYKNYAKVISVLKETNPDTVGWLTVNNTTVNYPIVQTVNNSYYLNHDFNKNSNSLGWVFMDYRNNSQELDQNTILYGHNVSNGRIMFGDLHKTLNASWYQNINNQYITFNTATGDKVWRIFSIYKIEATNDYLYNKFETQEDYLAFANKMKDRSIYNFGVDIPANSKILTLSTCQQSKYRLVIHAIQTV